MPAEHIICPELVEIRAARARDSIGTLVGLAAVYYDGTPATEFSPFEGMVERVARGAFDDWLVGDGEVLALSDHETSNAKVLGRRSSGTLRLSLNPKGLRYEVDLPDTTEGRDLRELVARGDIAGASFGFDIRAGHVDLEWSTAGGVDIRTIKRAELHDIAPVAKPAYQATSTSLRSRAGYDDYLRGRVAERLRELERLRRRREGL